MNFSLDTIALHVSQLSVNYDKTPILWDISLKVPAGKLVSIIGPNGAGKSTFIKAVLGLIKPLSGKIAFFDRPLKEKRAKIGYVPQRETVDWDFPITVRDVVLMGCYGKLGLFHWPKKKELMAVEHYLEIVGMQAYAKRQINELSGGQQQRVFLARALLQEADIYFMDEPFAGIDLASERVMINLLRKLQEEGKTIFVVHHDLNTIETYFDWAIMLNMRLIACGPLSSSFNADTLHATFGKSYALFDHALRLSQHKLSGLT